jgi:hypothetical protein
LLRVMPPLRQYTRDAFIGLQWETSQRLRDARVNMRQPGRGRGQSGVMNVQSCHLTGKKSRETVNLSW